MKLCSWRGSLTTVSYDRCAAGNWFLASLVAVGVVDHKPTQPNDDDGRCARSTLQGNINQLLRAGLEKTPFTALR
jgi:hypothetical protein